MLFIIGIIIIVCILILLNLDSPLKTKINIIINLLFIIMLLLIVNVYMLYPQYQNNLDIHDTIQEFGDFLQDWNELQPRTSGTGEKNSDSRINDPDVTVSGTDSDYKNPGIFK